MIPTSVPGIKTKMIPVINNGMDKTLGII